MQTQTRTMTLLALAATAPPGFAHGAHAQQTLIHRGGMLLVDAAPLPLWLLLGACFVAGALAVAARRSAGARGLLAAAGLLVAGACFAPVIPVPHEFQNGQPADATQVNQNFSTVTAQIGEHADDTDLHPTSVDGLAGGSISSTVFVAGNVQADGLVTSDSNVQAQQDVFAGRNVIADGTVFASALQLQTGAAPQGLISVTGDGTMVLQVPGSSSAIYLYANGDVEISGTNVKVNATADLEANAGQALTTSSGTTWNASSGMSMNVTAGGSTNLASSGAFSIQATTIDLN